MAGDAAAIQDGLSRDGACALGCRHAHGALDVLYRQRQDLIDAAAVETQRLDHRPRGFGGLLGGRHLDQRPALHDGAVEEALRPIHGHQQRDFASAAALAEYQHIARIATELGDVVAHPFERQHQVENAGGAGIGEAFAMVGQVKLAKNVEPMIDAHDHDVTALGEPDTVVGVAGTRTGYETATVEPDHDRTLAAVAQCGRPDVEEEAVLALGQRRVRTPGPEEAASVASSRLWGGEAIVARLQYASPWRGGSWRRKARDRSVRTVARALEAKDAGFLEASDLTRLGACNQCIARHLVAPRS
jgi:hypothetical protein